MTPSIAGIAADLLRPFGTLQGGLNLAFTLLAALLVIAASFSRTMVPLRSLTVASNLAFLGAALSALNPVSLLLYCVLIPLNTLRLVEIVRLTRKVTQAANGQDLSGIWLKPYMRSHRLRAGTTLFRQGDKADALYLLAEGDIELVEIGKHLQLGELFGEISFFAPDGRRTRTARCVTDCLVLSIGEAPFKQLYFENPKFAFQVVNLITQRLDADVRRLEAEVARLRSPQACGEPRSPP
jgi:hypothetical protein